MSETKLIYKKMVEVMKSVGPVTKDGTNTAQGYKFRGIDAFINALHPALIKHSVLMVPSATSVNTEIREVVRSNGKPGVDKHVSLQMNYTFYAEDGSSVVVGPIPAEGLDSGDKATNKALSAALKYALIQTFTVPTEDMAEADLDTPEITLQNKKGPEKNNTVLEKNPAAPSPAVSNAGSVPTPSTTTSSPTPRRSTSFRKPPVVLANPNESAEAKTNPRTPDRLPAKQVTLAPQKPVDDWT